MGEGAVAMLAQAVCRAAHNLEPTAELAKVVPSAPTPAALPPSIPARRLVESDASPPAIAIYLVDRLHEVVHCLNTMAQDGHSHVDVKWEVRSQGEGRGGRRMQRSTPMHQPWRLPHTCPSHPAAHFSTPPQNISRVPREQGADEASRLALYLLRSSAPAAWLTCLCRALSWCTASCRHSAAQEGLAVALIDMASCLTHNGRLARVDPKCVASPDGSRSVPVPHAPLLADASDV